MNLRPCLLSSLAVLALQLATVAALAQTPAPATSTTPLTQPVLVELTTPEQPSIWADLQRQNIRVLHHYGQGRYLLSAAPQHLAHKILPPSELSQQLDRAQRLSAYDQVPELRESVLQAAQQRHQRTAALRAADSASDPAPASNSAIATRPASAQADAAARQPQEVTLVLAFPDAVRHLEQVLAEADFRITGVQVEGGTTLSGLVSPQGIARILEHPYILDVSAAPDELIPYNFEGRITHNVTVLNSGIAGAPHLNGAGVVVGVGDGGYLSGHPDIGHRVLHTTSYYNAGWGAHPDMVSGIIGGAGVVDPNRRGTASEAELVVEASSTITFLAPTYQRDYGMTLTNNSYGPSFDCSTAGKYYGASASVDQQLYDHPTLLHVYASGNSGRANCSPLLTPYGTLPAGAQCAKNTLSVGNAYHTRELFVSSSCGPTFDGRIKPEVVGVGTSVVTNNRTGAYTTGTGTSMSSPAVVGLLALLTEHFGALHAGTRPDGALLKAIICNTAEDLGNAGPDYKWGFGLVDGTAALEAISHQHYTQGDLAPGQVYTHTLSVTPGTQQLAVMLYWPDVQGPTLNNMSVLVNDFDVLLVTPAGDTVRPWVLNPLQPQALAVRGTDRLNNIEQVTLDNPTAGNYTVIVKATHLPLGTSDYVLSWRLPQPAVQLTCPFGGETLTPGQPTFIAWAATPAQTGTWTLEYAQSVTSSKGGAASAGEAKGTWQTIQAGIAPNTRSIVWTPPNTVGTYVFRITNDVTGLTDATDEPVGLLGTPTGLHARPVCNGDIRLAWQPVTGATAYDVFRFDGDDMHPAGTVTDTLAFVSNLITNEQTLFSVRAKGAGGIMSQRAYAIAETPTVNGMNCYSPLPVTWTEIRTEDAAKGVRVIWSVASEYNNDYYEVLRGRPHGDTLNWQLVTTVDGRGTSNEAARFAVEDALAPEGTTIYYRVVQQDFDGARLTSKTVAHERESSSIVEAAPFTLSQNPVIGDIQLNVSGTGSGHVELYDTAGRLAQTYEVSPGVNRLAWPANFPQGLYLLRLAGAGEATTIKLVKG